MLGVCFCFVLLFLDVRCLIFMCNLLVVWGCVLVLSSGVITSGSAGIAGCVAYAVCLICCCGRPSKVGWMVNAEHCCMLLDFGIFTG